MEKSPLSKSNSVTAVIINYQTPDLTLRAISSFQNFYTNIPILIIDNGSKDNSLEILKNIENNNPKIVSIVANKKNLHHGPAMHQAVDMVQSDFLLFLDSDCEIIKGGFIEEMLELLNADQKNYAVGKLVHMNKRGFDIPTSKKSIKYIHPTCILLRKSIYQSLQPFKYHGTPCLNNMIDANRKGFTLIDFDVKKFVIHKGRGTASRFGYNLGLKGKINFLLNKLGV